MISLALAAFALIQRQEAVIQRKEAETQRQAALLQASAGLAAQALAELEGTQSERAVLLALEALEHYPYTPQAEAALARRSLRKRYLIVKSRPLVLLEYPTMPGHRMENILL